MIEGTWVKYIGCIEEQAKWSCCDDPRPVLIKGEIYQVRKVVMHSWHTKIGLWGIEGMFNSVCFVRLDKSQLV